MDRGHRVNGIGIGIGMFKGCSRGAQGIGYRVLLLLLLFFFQSRHPKNKKQTKNRANYGHFLSYFSFIFGNRNFLCLLCFSGNLLFEFYANLRMISIVFHIC